jgi:hypothetical protein
MNLTLPAKKIVLFIGIVVIVIIAAGAAIYRSHEAFYFAFGVILTSLLNVFKILMLDHAVRKAIDLNEPNIGKNYLRLQYLIRYLLTGMVLLAAGLISVYVDPPFINIWGAVAGIFTLQISVIIVRSMNLDEKKKAIDPVQEMNEMK